MQLFNKSLNKHLHINKINVNEETVHRVSEPEWAKPGWFWLMRSSPSTSTNVTPLWYNLATFGATSFGFYEEEDPSCALCTKNGTTKLKICNFLSGILHILPEAALVKASARSWSVQNKMTLDWTQWIKKDHLCTNNQYYAASHICLQSDCQTELKMPEVLEHSPAFSCEYDWLPGGCVNTESCLVSFKEHNEVTSP